MAKRIDQNGHNRTMVSLLPADYLIAEEGKILGTGRGEPPVLSGDVQRIDLHGRALMPAFLDPHSHLSAVAHRQLQLSLSGIGTPDAVLKEISRFLRENQLKKGEWLAASDYEPEGRRLTARELDAVAPENPLVLQYTSGHMGVFNGAALQALGVGADTPSAEGGLIEKGPDGTPYHDLQFRLSVKFTVMQILPSLQLGRLSVRNSPVQTAEQGVPPERVQ